MSNFDRAFDCLGYCEFDSAISFCLEKAKGENFLTWYGINERDEPSFAGWQPIHSIQSVSEDLSDASTRCWKDPLIMSDTRNYYQRKLWETLNCKDLPEPIARRAFVHGALLGSKTMAYILQVTLGAKLDGTIGKYSVQRSEKLSPSVIEDFDTIVCIHLRNKAKGSDDLYFNEEGWTNRIKKVKEYD